MPENLYITACTVINSGSFYKNEALIYENKQVVLQDFLQIIYQDIGVKYPKFYKMDSLSKLGWLAAELLLKDSFDKEKYKPEEVGIILSNANSSFDADIKYFESTREMASPALFVYTLPNIVIGEISIRHGFKGENAFFIFEKFNPGFLEKYVSNLFNNNILQACICGWIEAAGEQYQVVLFLVERLWDQQPDTKNLDFTEGNLNKLYHLYNG